MAAAAAAAPPQTWPTPCRRSRRAASSQACSMSRVLAVLGTMHPAATPTETQTNSEARLPAAVHMAPTRSFPPPASALAPPAGHRPSTGALITHGTSAHSPHTADRHTLGCQDASAQHQKRRLCDSLTPRQLVVVMQNPGTPQQPHQQWQGCTLLLLGHQQRPVRRRQLWQLVGGCIDLDGRQLRWGCKGEAAVVAGGLRHPPAWQQSACQQHARPSSDMPGCCGRVRFVFKHSYRLLMEPMCLLEPCCCPSAAALQPLPHLPPPHTHTHPFLHTPSDLPELPRPSCLQLRLLPRLARLLPVRRQAV